MVVLAALLLDAADIQAQTLINIESPNTTTSYLGLVTVSGWAYDNSQPISSVAIAFDGVAKGNAVYGNQRTDVCTSGQHPGCPYVGWYMNVDMALLSQGSHTMTATATTSDGRQTNATRSFTVTAAQTLMYIDAPNTTTSYLGSFTASGWAYDTAYSIGSVTVSVDGVSKGTATYGNSRTDVCTTGQHPGCPYVGLYLQLDAALLSQGSHNMVVTVTTSDGRQVTGTRTFSVTAAQTLAAIDLPMANTAYLGTTLFSGWLLDTATAISSVALAIDGVSYGNANYGGLRTDVCSTGQYPGCSNVGWSLPIDLALLQAGSHTLTVTGTTSDGRQAAVARTFTVTAAATTIVIDAPAVGGTYVGALDPSGWALDNANTISSVFVSLDGVAKGNAVYGASRTDVCTTSEPGCPNVGWYMGTPIDTSLLAGGSHTLLVTAVSSDGRQTALSRTFTVQAAQIQEVVEAPTANGTIATSSGFGGWAYDTGYPIGSVAVILDGASAGNATYGYSRTDVCSSAQHPGCPNVGWSFSASAITPGSHTFSVIITTTDGRSATTPTINFSVTGADSSATPKKEYIYVNGQPIAIVNHP